MKSKEIMTDAMHMMMEDSTYIKIATLTSFIHALVFNGIILYYLFEYSTVFSEDTAFGKLLHTYIDQVSFSGNMIGWIIVVGLILLIGYELIPPIGEAAMIYHLDEDVSKKDGFRALAKGLYKFFPMLEYGVSTSLFKVTVILTMVIRLVLFGLWDNILIMVLMSIWMVIAFFVNLLLPYSKMLICLDHMSFFDAMKRSVSISIQNIGVTTKFVIINFLLSIRFIINIVFIIGIPIVLVWLGARLGLQDIGRLNTLFLIVLLGLIVFVAYIEGIIEGFFTAAWMNIYKRLPKEDLN